MAKAITVTHKDTGITEGVVVDAVQSVTKVPFLPGNPNAKPPSQDIPESAVINWRNGAERLAVSEKQADIVAAMNA